MRFTSGACWERSNGLFWILGCCVKVDCFKCGVGALSKDVIVVLDGVGACWV
jgi:hypothetical protein